jgi:hypothetical protein
VLCSIFYCCSSWGFLVHRVIAQLAVYELPEKIKPFFFTNRAYLVKQSVRPDLRRNTDPTENPKHFIDIEMYGDSAMWKMPTGWDRAVSIYSRDTLVKYGYLPYEVVMMKDSLTRAIRDMNKERILFYCADLCHYISDANVPLHTTSNYDGQLSGQKGIHALWETEVPEIELNQYDLYCNHEAEYIRDPAITIWEAIRHAHSLLGDLFAQETALSGSFTDSTKYHTQIRNGKTTRSYSSVFAKAYSKELGSSINDQLKLSANLVADFWYTCWVDAGRPDLRSLVSEQLSKETQQTMHAEQEAYKQNKLIQNDLLIARQHKTDNE